MATPNLNLPTVPSGQTSISQAFNEAMQILDAMAQLAVVDRDLSTPPITTGGDVGKCYIVGASPTGLWTGHVNHVALCTAAGVWRFIVPRLGTRAYVIDESQDCRFTGSSWSVIP